MAYILAAVIMVGAFLALGVVVTIAGFALRWAKVLIFGAVVVAIYFALVDVLSK